MGENVGDNPEYTDVFVKRSGSTMTGTLEIWKPRTSSNQNSFRILGRLGGVENSVLFKDYQRSSGSIGDDYIEYFGTTSTNNSILNRTNADSRYLRFDGATNQTIIKNLVVNGIYKCTRANSNQYAFEVTPSGDKTRAYIRTNGTCELKPDVEGGTYGFAVYPKGLDANNAKCAFRVVGDGSVKAGHDSSNPFMASANNDVVTKKYLDENAGKTQTGTATNPSLASGEMYWNTTLQVLYVGN